jgi:hypothetical protein
MRRKGFFLLESSKPFWNKPLISKVIVQVTAAFSRGDSKIKAFFK